MEQLENTNLSVELLEEGQEKTTKQVFNNVKANPDSAKVINLGEILAAIAPEYTVLESILKTEKTRIIKDEQVA